MSIQIEVDHMAVVSYVNAAGRLPFIQQIRLRDDSGKTYSGIQVEFEVSSLGTALAETHKIPFGQFAQRLEISEPETTFDLTNLYQVTDQQPGELKVRVVQGEETLAEHKSDVQILSVNSWVGESPMEQSTKALAAFVQPQHPALNKVRKLTAEIMEKSGMDPALSGYQQGPEHIRGMVKAAFEAMQSLGLTYVNPPASWDLKGNGGDAQRIRGPEQVIGMAEGTCLDTTVVFAALLESIGLNPIVFLIPGHAFVGYWQKEAQALSLQIGQYFDIYDAQNLFDGESKSIEVVETTDLCDKSVDFDTACKNAIARMLQPKTGINREVSGACNVVGGRFEAPKILPLPAQAKKPDGSVETVEYTPTTTTLADITENLSTARSSKTKVETITKNVPPMVKRWLDELLDLSLRNPLLNFRWGPSSVPILSTEGLPNSIEDIIQAGQTLALAPMRDEVKNPKGWRGTVDNPELKKQLIERLAARVLLTNLRESAFDKGLRTMVSSAKSLKEETGSNGLFLALGVLAWTPSGKETEITSPLILVPVNLISKNRGKEFNLELDESSAVTPNFSLVEKLKTDEGIELPGLVDLAADDFGIDVNGTFEYVRSELKKKNMKGFRVDETAVLGFFNFTSYRQWRDLLDNWQVFEENSLVKHLIRSPNEEFKQADSGADKIDLDSLQAELPVENDSSQAKAIAKAISGETFVMQGPPGTGKSQTITNLLAKALHDGKRVLFVAQKKDALDVVKERLDRIHLGPFVLDLHDKGMTPKAVKEQIKNVLDIQIKADKPGLKTSMSEYQSSVEPLIAYKKKLFEDTKYGVSIQGALNASLNYQSQTDQPVTVDGDFMNDWTDEKLASAERDIKELASIGSDSGSAATNPWSFSRLIKADAVELQSNMELKEPLLNAVSLSQRKSDGADSLIEKLEFSDFRALASIANSGKNTSSLSQVANEYEGQKRSELNSLVINAKEIIQSLPLDPTNLDRVALDVLYAKAIKVESGGSFLRSWKQNRISKELSKSLSEAVIVPAAGVLETIEKLKTLKTVTDSVRSKVLEIQGFDGAALNSNNSQDLDRTVDELEILNSFSEFTKKFADEASSLVPSEMERVLSLSISLKALFELVKANESSLEMYKGEVTLGSAIQARLRGAKEDLDNLSLIQLVRWAELYEIRSNLDSLGLSQAADELTSGGIGYSEALASFRLGYYEAMVQRLIFEQGLNTFDDKNVNRAINKLSQIILDIRSLTPAVMADEVLSRRGFDSSAKAGRIGELVAAVNMTKSRTSIKNLLTKHWDVITSVTPCVLAVPDAVVRFLNAENEKFDMVVFDEASQIPVPYSIGAMGRGHSTIVVGDSKQMPPTSVAQTSTEVDEEQIESALDFFVQESILSLCEISRVPDVMLNWHYRSNHESLIAYSNKTYYGGSLKTLPSPLIDNKRMALSYEYFPNGNFNRSSRKGEGNGRLRTNAVEVEAIVNEIVSRLRDPAHAEESIGVVTFNKQQQNEIREQLEYLQDEKVSEAMDSKDGKEYLFIKNLETVQGSERDVILFSTAFSLQDGKLPLTFGPLNGQGGGKRLNVAITRARKEMKVFTSFKPSDIDLNRTGTEGLTQLREFLTLVWYGPEAIGLGSSSEANHDVYRQQVADALTESGLKVDQSVGMSGFRVDLAIRNPEDESQYLVALNLDGPEWGERATALDRDIMPRALLRGKMGWPEVQTLWLPNWVRNRNEEIEKIVKLVKENSHRRVEVKQPEFTSKTNTSQPVITTKDVATEDPLKNLLAETPSWQKAKPFMAGTAADLDYDLTDGEAMVRLFVHLYKSEGPVSPERFARFAASCYGFQKVAPKRIAQLTFAGQQICQGKIGIDGFFFTENPDSFVGWRKAQVEQRDVEQISFEEISNAMSAICSELQGISKPELLKETSRVFGANKLSGKIGARLETVLDKAVQYGKIEKRGDYLHISGDGE